MGMLARIRSVIRPRAEGEKVLTLTDPSGWGIGGDGVFDGRAATAMKISAVNAAVEIRSDSFGKLPVFVMDSRTKEHIDGHYVTRLLADRPNEAMSPFVLKKLLEVWRLQWMSAQQAIEQGFADGMLYGMDDTKAQAAVVRQARAIYAMAKPQDAPAEGAEDWLAEADALLAMEQARK